MSFSNVHFILFKPQLAENIGACARALKNFNFTKLKLVSPKINFPNEKVFATSVGAKDIINSSKVYSNFEDAIKNINCVIATSSRIRKKNYKYIDQVLLEDQLLQTALEDKGLKVCKKDWQTQALIGNKPNTQSSALLGIISTGLRSFFLG